MNKEFKDFEEFYPYYIDEHKNKHNKLLHFIGTTISLNVAKCSEPSQRRISHGFLASGDNPHVS